MNSLTQTLKFYKKFVRDAKKFIYTIETQLEHEKIGLFKAPVFKSYYDAQGNFDREKSNQRHERRYKLYLDEIDRFNKKPVEVEQQPEEDDEEEIILLNRPLIKFYFPEQPEQPEQPKQQKIISCTSSIYIPKSWKN